MSKTLQQKNTRYLLVWLPLILIVASILFFLLMSFHAHHMQEKYLQLKQQNVVSAFKLKNGNLDPHIVGEYDIVERTPLDAKILTGPRDTSIFYPDKNKKIPFSVSTNNFSFNGKTYQISTYVSTTEITHLVAKVFLAEAVILVALLVAITIINRTSSRKLWRPFYGTIAKMNDFDIARKYDLELSSDTGVAEFDTLNKEISNLTERANASYIKQKEFVDNASHEMQTPLAIIRSKLDLLINQPGITEHTASLLSDITDANNRLSQMNKNLLLLSRIENNQFIEKEKLNLSELIENLLNTFLGYYEGNMKDITVNIQQDFFVTANRSLVEVLITNLIMNAIIHNVPDGQIKAQLQNKKLTLENTGQPVPGDPKELLERFKKGNENSKTTGLGLSIVKTICQLYNYKLDYTYNDNIHKIVVEFT